MPQQPNTVHAFSLASKDPSFGLYTFKKCTPQPKAPPPYVPHTTSTLIANYLHVAQEQDTLENNQIQTSTSNTQPNNHTSYRRKSLSALSSLYSQTNNDTTNQLPFPSQRRKSSIESLFSVNSMHSTEQLVAPFSLQKTTNCICPTHFPSIFSRAS